MKTNILRLFLLVLPMFTLCNCIVIEVDGDLLRGVQHRLMNPPPCRPSGPVARGGPGGYRPQPGYGQPPPRGYRPRQPYGRPSPRSMYRPNGSRPPIYYGNNGGGGQGPFRYGTYMSRSGHQFVYMSQQEAFARRAANRNPGAHQIYVYTNGLPDKQARYIGPYNGGW